MIATQRDQSSQGHVLAEVLEDISGALHPPGEWQMQAVIAQDPIVWVHAVYLPTQEVFTIMATRLSPQGSGAVAQS